MQNLVRQPQFSWARLSLWLLAVIYLWVFFNFSAWRHDQVIMWDAYEYYLYLPSVFVHHSFDLSWAMDELHKIGQGVQWDFLSPTGKPVNRMSMGLAMLYVPFFLLGHGWALLSGAPADGFSAPYYFCMLLGTLVYAMLGNILLRKVLARWFSDRAVAYTLVVLNLGTNLFYFVTTDPLITHVASFFLFAVFLYLTVQWYERMDLLSSLLVGHVAGIVTLTRPTNGLILLFFLLWGVKRIPDLGARIRLFSTKFPLLLAMAGSTFLVFVPQLIYWKMQTGQWYYYSYGHLGAFYFNHPHVLDGLFSYRKGWLLYTPVMLFALAGFFLLKRYVSNSCYAILVFTVLNFYVVVSFWCWWYGAGFGLRPMVDSYPLLALPMTACIEWMLAAKNRKRILIPVFVLLLAVNQLQTYQARKNILHFDSVTGSYYWAVFLRLDNREASTHLLQKPDYAKAMQTGQE